MPRRKVRRGNFYFAYQFIQLKSICDFDTVEIVISAIGSDRNSHVACCGIYVSCMISRILINNVLSCTVAECIVGISAIAEDLKRSKKKSKLGFINNMYDTIEKKSGEYAQYKLNKRKNKKSKK